MTNTDAIRALCERVEKAGTMPKSSDRLRPGERVRAVIYVEDRDALLAVVRALVDGIEQCEVHGDDHLTHGLDGCRLCGALSAANRAAQGVGGC